MSAHDSQFMQVELESNSPSACTPALPEGDWLGIVIAAPSRVEFASRPIFTNSEPFARIPICGAYTLGVASPPTNEPIVLVAYDTKRGLEFSGPVRSLDESPQEQPPDLPPPSAAQLAGMTVTSYFHHNLAAHVQLPVRPATYSVFVRWRGYESNRVDIELVEVALAQP